MDTARLQWDFSQVTSSDIQEAIAEAGLQPLPTSSLDSLKVYLDLLLKWNSRLNLTAIREPEAIVRRHFIESLVGAERLPQGIKTLLDFGSGAGFPGIPIAIRRPEIAVTLGESQAKKSAFLREAGRALGIPVEVYDGRIEFMPETRQFGAVALRAVDRMEEACVEALRRVETGGWLVLFATRPSVPRLIAPLKGVAWRSPVVFAGAAEEVILMGRKLAPVE